LKDLDYNDCIKETFYIGLKVLYSAIKPDNVEVNKNNWAEVSRHEQLMFEKKENLKEILSFDGVQLINDIIGLILYFSKQHQILQT